MRSTGGIATFVDEPPGPCPRCSGVMRVQKTVRRRGVTLEHGAFTGRETVYACAAGCRRKDGAVVAARAASLRDRLPPGGVFGYDVTVAVGCARFLEHKQREDIRRRLAEQHGIVLSSGEVTGLSRRFLAYLESLHEARAPQLRAALAQDGGWPLHVDATGEDGRGTLLLAYTGWRGWVLGTWKVPTERAEVITPRLREVVARFGDPCALVRDLGRAVTQACDELVAALDGDVPVLACHLHFLRDVGKDLLGDGHDAMRALIRRFKVKAKLRALARDLGRKLGTEMVDARRGMSDWQAHSEQGHALPDGAVGLACVRAIAQWVLDYRADGNDEGFPFDLPYLALHDRCRSACRAVDAFLRRPSDDAQVRKALTRLRRILHPVESQVPFGRVAASLRARNHLFTELRRALRLKTKPARTHAPPPEPAAAEIQDVQRAVKALTVSLRRRRPARGPAQDRRKAIDIVLDHLQRHRATLFGHVIDLPKHAGGGIRLVHRTNNSIEGFFHDLKHGERRRSGRKILTQDFEQLPAAATLAANLRCADYVAILCGSLDQLPRAFARLDAADRRRSLPAAREAARANDSADGDVVSASLPRADRDLIRTEAMQRRIRAAATSRAPRRCG